MFWRIALTIVVGIATSMIVYYQNQQDQEQRESYQRSKKSQKPKTERDFPRREYGCHTCVICQEPMTHKGNILKLDCGHKFHETYVFVRACSS